MMPPLETLPTNPRGIRVGEYFTSGLFCLQRKHLACEYFITFCFSRGGVVSASPNPQAGGHPLSTVRDCLFNLFAATLHVGGRSSIRKLRTLHAAVTGTHKHGAYQPRAEFMSAKYIRMYPGLQHL